MRDRPWGSSYLGIILKDKEVFHRQRFPKGHSFHAKKGDGRHIGKDRRACSGFGMSHRALPDQGAQRGAEEELQEQVQVWKANYLSCEVFVLREQAATGY